MNRAHCILLTLVAAALTLPVEAGRPNSPGPRSKSPGRIPSAVRVGANAPTRPSGPVVRPAAPKVQPGSRVPRSDTRADLRHLPPRQQPDATARQPMQRGPRVAVPGELSQADAVMPNVGQPRARIATPEKPDLPLPTRTVVDVDNPLGNGGGGNGGGGNGGGGGGGGHRPPPGRHPGYGGRGPTVWNAVAIGLATAAFADRGVATGGCSVADCVTVGQPACGAAATLVESEPIVLEQEVEPTAPLAAAGPATDDDSAPAAPESLPQLRVGTPFTLPAAGLGAAQGSVAVKIGAVILECPVTDWDEAGLAATLPGMALAAPTKAELLVAFADGTLAVAMPVELLPATTAVVARTN